jgi:hypothetical protein
MSTFEQAYYSLSDGHVRMLLDVVLEHVRHSASDEGRRDT